MLEDAGRLRTSRLFRPATVQRGVTKRAARSPGPGVRSAWPRLAAGLRRAFGRAGRAAAIVVPFALAALWQAAPAEAQATRTLVSNYGQSGSIINLDNRNILVQPFTTGANPSGYELSRVRLTVDRVSSAANAAVEIRELGPEGTDANNRPAPTFIGDTVTLRNPSSIAAGADLWFAAPAGTVLKPNTTYAAVTRDNRESPDNFDYAFTARVVDNNLGETGAPGWNIADYLYLSFSNAASLYRPDFSARPRVVRLAIEGFALAKPQISGVAQAGQTLEVSAGDFAFRNALGNVTFLYQWIRVAADNTETEIPGATGRTYTLAPADAGGRIRARVRFTDAAGIVRSLESDAYPSVGTVQAMMTACPAPALTGRAQIWSGSLTVGTIRNAADTVTSYGWSGGQGSLDPTSFAFRDESYTIDGVTRVLAPAPDGELLFSLTGSLSDTARSALVLHVCDRAYPLASGEADYDAAGHDYRWSGTGLDWSTVSGRTLYLSVDNVRPNLVSAVATGGSLVLTYSETLDPDSTPDGDAFLVSIDGAGTAPYGASVSGATVTLSLGTQARFGETVTVSYDVPSSDPIRDVAGNAAPPLANRAVTNNSPDVDTTLSALTVRDGNGDAISFSPSFSPAVVRYAARVSHAVDSVTVAATASDQANATVVVSSGNGQPAPLEASRTPNTITVTVTNGAARSVYNVSLYRPPTDLCDRSVVARADILNAYTPNSIVWFRQQAEGLEDRYPGLDLDVCDVVTPADLEIITTLHVGSASNTLYGTDAGDYHGLSGLTGMRFSGQFNRFLDGNLLPTLRLPTLPTGFFSAAGLNSLTLIFLDSVGLTRIPADAFLNLPRLSSLDIRRNSGLEIEAGAFSTNTNLTYLDLGYNAMRGLPAGLFDGLTRLNSLDLGGNPLSRLPPDIFQDLTSLEFLTANETSNDVFTPVAEAGDDRIAAPGETVTLEGTVEGAWGSNVRYAWTQVDRNGDPVVPPTVTLNGADTATPSFTAPSAVEILYFKLRAEAPVSGILLGPRGDGHPGLEVSTRNHRYANEDIVQVSTDDVAPSVTITEVPATSDGPFTATFTFSEAVTGFTVEDIAVGNGAASEFTETETGTTWTALITPAEDGEVTVDVAADVATDESGNGNAAATRASSDYAAPNVAPVFDDDALTRSVAENAGPGTNVGAAVPAATDGNNDALTYTLEGVDEASFDFDGTTRQIATKADVVYDYEAKSSYTVTVKAEDGRDGMDSVEVTINLTDVEEPPDAPEAPTVTATSGSTTGLDVAWAAPPNDGKPPITDYDLRYCAGSPSDCTADGDFTDGPEDETGTSAVIAGLDEGTLYQVQVRATNADGDGGWSESGGGSTEAVPTVTIAGVPDTSDGPFTATFTFSEAVTGFTVEDIAVVNGTVSEFTETETGTAWTALITPTSDGQVTVDVAADVAEDEAGNGNTAARRASSAYAAPNNLPTSADNEVATQEDTAYAFRSGDFDFDDVDGDGVFSGVTVTALPAAGKGGLWVSCFPDFSASSCRELTAGDLPFTAPVAGLDNDDALKYRPPENANGDDFAAFRFRVNDGTDDSGDEYTMTIDVTAVNDAPTVVKEIEDQTATENEPFSFTFPEDAFADVDGETLHYSATKGDGDPLPGWLTFDAGTRTFQGTPGAGDTGTLAVKVTAADGDGETASDRFDIVVRVQPGVSVAPASLSLREGETASYAVALRTRPAGQVTITPGSSDTDALTVSPASLTFTPSDWDTAQAVSVTAADDDDGADETVTISHDVSGYGGVTSAAAVTVTVTDDDAPAFGVCDRTPAVRDEILEEVDGVTDCADVTVAHLNGITGFLNLSGRSLNSLQSDDFADLSGVTVLWLSNNSLSDLPASVFAGLTGLRQVYLTNNALSGLPANIFNGLASLEWIYLGGNPSLRSLPEDIFDGLSGLYHLRFAGSGLVCLPRSLPWGRDDLNIDVDLPDCFGVSLSVAPTEVEEGNDGDTITVTATLSAGARATSARTRVSVTVEGGTATEGTDFTAVDPFNITIPSGGVSRTGTFTLTAAADAEEETDGETVAVRGTTSLSASSVPGTEVTEATVTIRDGIASTFTSTSTNNAPTVASAIADQEATVGAEFTFTVPDDAFEDIDGDTLQYSATQGDDTPLPSWLTFDAATRTFTGTPGAGDTGTLTVKVTVRDGAGETASDQFDIVVSPPADTTAPTVLSIVRHAPADSPTNADSLTWRVTFSEDVRNVDAADFAVDGSTATVTGAQAVSGETGVHDVTVSGGNLAELDGTVTLGFASGQDIADTAAPPNALTATAPSGVHESYTLDNTAPTVTIGDVPAASDGPFTATFTFSEAVTGFTLEDIAVVNGAVSDFTGSDGDTAFTATITPAADGEVTVDVAADAAEDEAGNGNTAAQQASSTYTAPTTGTGPTLVGNDSDTRNYVTFENSRYFAQSFDAAERFTLDSLELYFSSLPQPPRRVPEFEVTLHQESSSRRIPDTKVADLTSPATITTGGANVFEAPADTVLAAGTYYVQVYREIGKPDETQLATGSNDESSDSLSGWSISDGSLSGRNGTSWTGLQVPFRLVLRGSVSALPDATLTGLTLVDARIDSGIALRPDFDPETTEYTANARTAPRLTLLPETAEEAATVAYQDGEGNPLADADGDPANGHQAALGPGENVIRIVVTAEDGVTTKEYTVTATREPDATVSGVAVTSTAPRYREAAGPNPRDVYGAGDAIEITVTFSGPVNLDRTNGDPTLAFGMGDAGEDAETANARYVRSVGTPGVSYGLVFAHTVQSSDSDDDGIFLLNDSSVTGGALQLNGATLGSGTEGLVSTAIASSEQTNHRVDGSRGGPYVESLEVTSTPRILRAGQADPDTYGAGETIEFTLALSEAVTVTGTPHLRFILDGANRNAGYARGSGSNELVFAYLVQSSDADADGLFLPDGEDVAGGDSAVVVESGERIAAMDDSADADLVNPDRGTRGGHRVDGSMSVFDTTAPTVLSIVRQDPADSPTNADSLTWRVTFSEDVANVDDTDFTVTGTTATLAVTEAAASTVHDVTASGGDLAELDGAVTLEFASGQDIEDTADTPNALTETGPTGTDERSYDLDNTAPTVTISDVPPASDAPFTATFTFSEPVDGFTVEDIAVVNGAVSDFTGSDGDTVYTALITPAEDGDVTVDVAADAAADAAGNGNLAATRATSTYAAPNNPPTSADNEVATEEDTAYTFRSGNFDFADADDGDGFTGVIVTALPAAGKGGLWASCDSTFENPSCRELTAADLPFTAPVAGLDDDDALKYRPPENANGDGFAAFRFRVNDGMDDSAAEYAMTIDVTAVNDAPAVANPIANQQATTHEEFTFTVPDDAFSDVEGGALEYSARDGDGRTLPRWLRFIGTTRTFEGTPTAAGTLTVRVTASDGDLEASDEFDIEVSEPPDAQPTVTIAGPGQLAEGVPLVFTLTRTGDLALPLTVNVEVTETFGLGDVLLGEAPTTVTFEANSATATVTVRTKDNQIPGGFTFVEIAVSPDTATPAGYILGSSSTSTMTVVVTDGAGNALPEFTDETLTRSVAENAAPGTDVGAPVPAAADGDGDALIYTMEGDDEASFDFDAATRQIATKAGVDYDFEAKDMYSVTIKADDDKGGTDTLAVTITLADADEPPDAPEPPSVTATPGSTTSLDVSWAAPANGGRPPITGYDLRYCAGSPADCAADGDFTDGPRDVTGTSATIPGLEESTVYQVQVRAGNDEGDGGWSDSGGGSTDAAVDAAAPRVASIVRHDPADSPTNADSLTWRVTFSEDVANVDAADFAVTGSTATVTGVQAVSGETGVHDVTASGGDLAGLDGTVTLGFAAAQDIEDLAGNRLANTTPTGAEENGYELDNTAPTVTISEVPGTTDGPFTATFTFSEAVTGFAQDDIEVGNGTLSGFTETTTGTVWTVLVTPTANGAVTLDIAANAATDQAGNGNTAAEQASSTFTASNAVPTVSNPIADQTAMVGEAFTFTVPDDAFADAGDTLEYSATLADSNPLPSWLAFTAGTRTFTGTPAAAGTLTVRVTATDGSDASIYDDFEIRVGSACPAPDFGDRERIWTGAVTVAEGQILGFYAAYGYLGSGMGALSYTDFDIGDNGYTVDALAVSDVSIPTIARRGSLIFSLTSGLNATERAALRLHVCDAVHDFSDATGDTTTRSYIWNAGLDWSGESERTAYLSLRANTPATGAPVIASSGSSAVGDVLTVATDGIEDDDGLPDTFVYQWYREDGDGSNRTAIPFATSSAYTLAAEDLGKRVRVLVAFTDRLGRDEERESGAFPDTGTVVAPNNAPTVANQIPNQAATAGEGFTFTVPDDAFADADTGDSLTYTAKLANDDPLPSWLTFDAATRTFTGTPGAAGTLTVRVTATDGSGASIHDDFDIEVSPPADTTAPTVLSIVRHDPADSPTNADSLAWRVTFSEDVANVDDTDFTLTGTTAALAVVEATASTVHDVTASGGNLADLDGTVTLGFASTQDITDTADTPNALAATAPTGTDERSWEVDNTAPTVTISDVPAASDGPFTATFEFSEPVTGFVVSDIAVGNGAASDFTNTTTGTGWTALITPSAEGEVTLDVAADAAEDEAGNGNTAAGQARSTYTAPNNAPTADDKTVTIDEDMSHTFTAGDFNFADADSGDTLASVRITQLESAGDLELDSVDVTLNQVIQKADIDGGRLVFTPAANANGTGYATFMFRVSDGDEESASAYTMTVDVDAVNDAPTVAEEIPDQAATVDEAFGFTVPAGTFEDVDGDSLEYSAVLSDDSVLPSWLTFNATTRTFTGTPGDGDTGTLTVKVTATDTFNASVHDEFEIEVNPAPPGNDAGLDTLTLANAADDSDIALTPAFDPATTAYTADAGMAARVTVTPGTADGNATVAYEDGGGNALADADGDSTNGHQVDLGLGGNVIGITVTAEDGVTTKEYTVTVTRDADATVSGVAVTSAAPRYREVAGPNVRDVYGEGDMIEFTATFSDTVDVDTANGVPALVFGLGGSGTGAQKNAEYVRGSGTTALVFAYAVQAADSDDDGIFLLNDSDVTGGALRRNGGVLSTGTDGVVSTAVSTRGNQDGHKVDGSRGGPYVTSLEVTSTPRIMRAGQAEPDTYGAGETIEFTLALSEAVTVTGTPHLRFSLDGTDKNAGYARGSGSNELVFAYPVQAADADADGLFLPDGEDVAGGDSAVVVESGERIAAMDDSADADLVNPGRGTRSGHRVDGSMSVFDTTAPTVLSIVRHDPSDSPTSADVLTWRVTFSEDVANVDNTDFTVSGTTAALAVAEVTASTVHDVTASGGDLAELDGTVTLGFASTQDIADTATPPNALAATAPSATDERSWVVDNTAPTVTISDVPATSDAPFTATFTFSEAVTGFTVGDIAVGNGTASDFTGGDGATTYTATINPVAAGEVTVSVIAEAAEDEAGNPSAAGTAATSTYSPNNPPTAENGEVDTPEDTPHTFTAEDFNFADTDAGDTLESVKITTLETTGDLELDGADVTVDQMIPKADIDAEKLIFTPAANANGTGYATFMFRVSDGDEESAADYTMSVNVDAVNDPATGAPAITGTARADETLTANADAIRDDADGLPAQSAFTWQWLRVGDPDDVEIPGATGTSYTLVETDEGERFRVRLRFTDLDGHAEELISEATLAVQASISSNEPPTAVSGTVLLAEDGSYAFKEADFGFDDEDAEDVLASVRIVTLPGAGSLTFDGAPVTQDQEVPAADLAKLVYAPPADANADGRPYTSFTFRVSDGTDESTDTYTMAINVTPENDAPTVANGIPDQTAMEDEAFSFTVPAGAFEDIDGDTLTYSATLSDASALPSWLTFDTTTRTFTGTPTTAGTITVRVTATDGSDASIHDDFDIAVSEAFVCTAPELTGRDVHWTATLTVAVNPDQQTETGYQNRSALQFGSLEPATFTIGTSPFQAQVLVHQGPAVISLTLDDGLADEQAAVATLHLCDTEFGFSSARLFSEKGTSAYLWDVSGGPLFSVGNEVTVRLSTPTPPSDNADLSALTLANAADDTNIALTPAFDSATLTYTADAGSAARITLMPTTADSGATVAYEDGGGNALADADGDPANGHQVDLPLIENVIAIIVTAEDGVTTKEYTVTATREPDATVSGVAVTSTAPRYREAAGPNPRDVYGAGDVIEFTVTFSDTVDVDTAGGVPRLVFSLGTGAAAVQTNAPYAWGSGTSTLVFAYAVQSSDSDDDGIFLLNDSGVAGGALQLNGATLGSGAEGLVSTAIASSEQTNHKVDGSRGGPYVESLEVTSTPRITRPGQGTPDTYGAGETIEFTLALSEAVTVTGTPHLRFSLDGTDKNAGYARGSGSNELVFAYLVKSSDADADGLFLPDGEDVAGGDSAVVVESGERIAATDDSADADLVNPGRGTRGGHRVDGSMSVFDTTAPTVLSIVRHDPSDSPTSADVLTWRVTFSEDVANVDDTDFTVTGTTATLAVTEAAASTVHDVTASGGDLAELDGAVTLEFASGQDIEDLAETPNALADTAPKGTDGRSWVVDNTAPTVDITEVPAASDAPFRATFTFSEGVDGFTAEDIAVVNGAVSDFTGSDGDTVYTALITPAADGDVTVDVAADAAADAAGNGNLAATRATSTYAAPNNPPTVANQIPNQAATVDEEFTFTVPDDAFEDVDGDTLDYSATLAGSDPLPDWLTFNAATREFRGTPTSAGTLTVKVTAEDGDGETASDEFDITVSPPPDTTAPTVLSIVRQDPADSPTNADSLTWRVTFSEDVANVDPADFTVTGSTATVTGAQAVSGETGVYDVTATGGNLAELDGTVTLGFASTQDIADTATPPNALAATAPSATDERSWVVDNTAPTVTISDVPATSDAPFTATFTFSEAVTGFTVGDIAVGNGTASDFTGGDGATTYTATINPVAAGEVTVSVIAEAAEDEAGNPSAAGTAATSTYSPNNPPTAENGEVDTPEDTPHTFTAEDFNFADTDAGDTLESVKITTLETTGDLELDGADVTVDQMIPKADIDAEKLIFTPAANANGTGYATFMFRVSDGDEESAADYTMSVNVDAVNDPATGAPAITGTARADETLTANADAIRDDADGLPAQSAFTWQWLRVGDPDDVEIPGATGTSYTLVETDEGERFRVRLRFTDLDGHAEELISEATLAVQASISSNEPPTAVSGTVLLAEDGSYAFKEADFGFDDEDAEDVLASVRIVTLPGAGSLTFDGAPVTQDQEVPAADLAKLVYAPPADANADGRPYTSFTFRVSDGTDESTDTYTMAINVTPENDAPTVANGIPDQTAMEDEAFSFTVPAGAFEDIDGDTLTYSATLSDASALPSWLTFDTTTRTFTGTPTTAGTITVRVTATDGSDASIHDDFDIVVSEAPPGNDAGLDTLTLANAADDSDIALTPAFDPATTAYTADAGMAARVHGGP